MSKVIELKTREDIIEEILFELIVLAADVPAEDKKLAAASIATLSGLPAEAVAILTENHKLSYENWKGMYAEYLVVNGLEDVADEINESAKRVL